MLASKNGGVDPNSLTADNFRPLKGFSDLNLATNGPTPITTPCR